MSAVKSLVNEYKVAATIIIIIGVLVVGPLIINLLNYAITIIFNFGRIIGTMLRIIFAL